MSEPEKPADETTPAPAQPPGERALVPMPRDFSIPQVVLSARWDPRAGCVRYFPLALVTSPEMPRNPDGSQPAVPVPFDGEGCLYPERIREVLTRAKLEAPPRLLVPKH